MGRSAVDQIESHMTTEKNQRQIPIRNAKSGETRMSAPVSEHTPHEFAERPESPEQTPQATPDARLTSDSKAGTRVTATFAPAAKKPANSPAGNKPVKAEGGKTSKQKTSVKKSDVQTLETLLLYAYERGGKPLSVDEKTVRAVNENRALDPAAQARLDAAIAHDLTLSVPRELLLLARDLRHYPELSGDIVRFVGNVIRNHPIFDSVIGTVNNIPGSLLLHDALFQVQAYKPRAKTGANAEQTKITGKTLDSLRQNAANLLIVWWSQHRSLSLDEVAALLLRAVWAPAGDKLTGDTEVLRALTEINLPAPVGWLGRRWQERATLALQQKDILESRAARLEQQLAEAEAQLQAATTHLAARERELEQLRAQTTQELADLHSQQSDERISLIHDTTRLRGRLTRSLEESVETLEVGLSALRQSTPRVAVMQERAEQVIDDLRRELKHLEQD